MAISFVGGTTDTHIGTGTLTLSLTSLTGGSDTAPSAGDLVCIFHGIASNGARTPTVSTSGYTSLDAVQANDNQDANLRVHYKRMGGTPDTSVDLSGANATESMAVVVLVFRDVDATTPLDVTHTTATGINSPVANPPAITPSTSGAWIAAGGVGAHRAGAHTFSSSNLTGFRSVGANATEDATTGAGYHQWTSGSFDPAAFTFSGTGNSEHSWAALTLALRPAGSGVSGTASITEADDTVSSAGTVRVAGAASITEASDTVASTGVVYIAGSASIAEAADTSSATGAVYIVGSASITEAGDTLSATGTLATLITGSASLTEADDASAATGTVLVSGALAVTEAGDTVASAAVVRVAGVGSITEASDTLVSAGVVYIVGSASLTEADDTLASVAASAVTGSAAITEAGDTLASAGAVLIVGALSVTEAGDTVSGAGGVRVAGALAVTEADDALSATGGNIIVVYGSAALTEASDSVASTGSISGAGAVARHIIIPGVHEKSVVRQNTAIRQIVDNLANFATLESPAFKGSPTASTPGAGDASQKVATTAFVQSELGEYAPLESPTFTGDPKAPTPNAGDNDTSIATTAFVTSAVAAAIAGLSTTITEAICGLIAVPTNKDYRIAINLPFACTILETTTRSLSGTCTATFKINTTALGGTANSVSSTEQTRAHSSANAVAAGDDIVITVSGNSSCQDLSFTIKTQRTIS